MTSKRGYRTGTAFAAMHRFLSHSAELRHTGGKSLFGTADHESQSACGRAAELGHGRHAEFRALADARRPARGDCLGLGIEPDSVRPVLIEIAEG